MWKCLKKLLQIKESGEVNESTDKTFLVMNNSTMFCSLKRMQNCCDLLFSVLYCNRLLDSLINCIFSQT